MTGFFMNNSQNVSIHMLYMHDMVLVYTEIQDALQTMIEYHFPKAIST